MELAPIATALGPTGVLATVLFSMWIRNKRNGHKPDEARNAIHEVINQDHDTLIRIETIVGDSQKDIDEVKSDVKGLLKDSHTHRIS